MYLLFIKVNIQTCKYDRGRKYWKHYEKWVQKVRIFSQLSKVIIFKNFVYFRKKIPTVSEKVDNEESSKKSRKKKSSNSKKDSNANLEQQKMTTKKKKSKKKSSKEEDSETTRSEINLLSASTDPKIELDNSENDRSEPKATAVVIEEPKKKTSKGKKKKSSRKSSVGSLKDQLADSHSSLRDFFPDTALKNYLQGLHVSLFHNWQITESKQTDD